MSFVKSWFVSPFSIESLFLFMMRLTALSISFLVSPMDDTVNEFDNDANSSFTDASSNIGVSFLVLDRSLRTGVFSE